MAISKEITTTSTAAQKALLQNSSYRNMKEAKQIAVNILLSNGFTLTHHINTSLL